jgi:hypothetical protein
MEAIAVVTTDHAKMRRLAATSAKRCLQISSQTRMLTAPASSLRPLPIAAKCVMHKLDNTIKAAALKAADQEGSA